MENIIGFTIMVISFVIFIIFAAGGHEHNSYMYYFIRLWEFLFDRWEITVMREENETWERRNRIHGYYIGEPASYNRECVYYKYKHKFFNKEKIVKKYLD